jgi:sugar phosphate permease
MTVAEARAHLPGLETSAAVRTRSFWMIALAQFCFAFAAAGAVIHLVTYLEGVGYSRSGAAWVISGVFALTSVGKISMGMFADRASARIALTVNFIAQVIGLFLALDAENTVVGVLFVLVFGLTAGPPLMLIPLLIAESMGLKRYGAISGLIALVNTLGAALGPLAAGWIFDATLSYTNAFELFMGAHVVGALASYTCRPLAVEEARIARAAAATASASA